MKKLIILCLIIFSFSYSFSVEKKDILVLNSYHNGLKWTDSVTEGIKAVFKDNSEIELYFEYLDTKRYHGDNYDKAIIQLYKQKINSVNFDGVIATDNAALNLIIENRDKLFADLPVVFCGVNNFRMELLKGDPNIHGIVERPDHRANLDLISFLHKDINRLVIINNENTLTGQQIMEDLESDLDDYKSKFGVEILSDFSLDELRSDLKNLDEKDIIYLLVFNRDKEGDFISYSQGIRLIKEVTSNPIYGAWDFYMGEGLLGGKIISGYEHGKEAGELLEEILQYGTPSENIIESNSGSKFIFDKRELNLHNIPERLLPRGSKLINRKEGFIYRNLKLIIFIFVVIIILLLSRLYYKIENEKMLQKLVEEKTAKLTKINKKLMEMNSKDILTEIYNRKFVIERLEEEIERSKRSEEPLTLIMLDVDNFKRINDNYGYEVGDNVIQELSRILNNNLRKHDIIGRYSGEEFLILLPGIDKGQGVVIAEKLRKRISEKNILDNEKITISGGVHQVEKHNVKEAINTVDELLYRAKTFGRDQIKYNLF